MVLNRGTDNLIGWAVPAATDIAFALAGLVVLGKPIGVLGGSWLVTRFTRRS